MSINEEVIIFVESINEKSFVEKKEQLIFLVNELINNDFNSLVNLLYKIDIDEKQLKEVLKLEAGVDSATVIAELIINRQLKKIKTRKQFSTFKKESSANDL